MSFMSFETHVIDEILDGKKYQYWEGKPSPKCSQIDSENLTQRVKLVTRGRVKTSVTLGDGSRVFVVFATLLVNSRLAVRGSPFSRGKSF